MDTGDTQGDLYFYIDQFYLPEECKDYPESFDCDNPEREDNDLVLTKVDLDISDTDTTTYSACNLCNGTDPFTHKTCTVGTYVCDCFAQGMDKCDPTKVGVENVTKFFVPQGKDSKCYQDIVKHCGELQHQGNRCERCVESQGLYHNNECTWVDASEFCTTAPCNETSADWICWARNAPRKFRGLWYSTLKEGRCQGGDNESNCSWTVRSTSTINETCMRERILTTVENSLPACFQACPDFPARNESSSCWISCFFEGIFGPSGRSSDEAPLGGISASKLGEAWDNAFLPVSVGGCEPIEMPDAVPRKWIENEPENSGDDACLLPPHGKINLNPFCYDCGNSSYASYVLSHDKLAHGHVFANGSCVDNGFEKFVRYDPLYKGAALYRKK